MFHGLRVSRGFALALAGIALAGIFVSQTSAEGSDPPAGDRVQKETGELIAKIEAAQAKLGLTDEQIVQVREVLLETSAKQKKAFQDHGVTRYAELTADEKVALARDLRPLRVEADGKLSSIMSDEQWSMYKEMRDAARREFRQKLKARQNG